MDVRRLRDARKSPIALVARGKTRGGTGSAKTTRDSTSGNDVNRNERQARCKVLDAARVQRSHACMSAKKTRVVKPLTNTRTLIHKPH